MSLAEQIQVTFDIIQSPDLEHLRIKITPILPDSHLDNVTLSLQLFPGTPVDDAQALENMLNKQVKHLWVNKQP